MRLIVVLAGAFGFLTVLAGSFVWEKPLDISLVNGIVSALVAAILFRWWMKIWISSLEHVSREGELSAQNEQFEEAIKPQLVPKLSELRKP